MPTFKVNGLMFLKKEILKFILFYNLWDCGNPRHVNLTIYKKIRSHRVSPAEICQYDDTEAIDVPNKMLLQFVLWFLISHTHMHGKAIPLDTILMPPYHFRIVQFLL